MTNFTQGITEDPPVSHPHFGEHLTIDAYECSAKKLNDQGNVFNCLEHLPEHLGMHKLSKPSVHYAEGTGPKDPGGWSGFVIIEESHISIHTFPLFGFVSIDVYTCQNGLDLPKIRSFFKKVFDIGVFEENFIVRGKKFAELAQRSLLVASRTCKHNGRCDDCRD